MVTGAHAALSESREFVADDTGLVGVEIEASGAFKLKISRQLPLIVAAQAPGFEPVFVVITTCDVNLEFVLGLKRGG